MFQKINNTLEDLRAIMIAAVQRKVQEVARQLSNNDTLKMEQHATKLINCLLRNSEVFPPCYDKQTIAFWHFRNLQFKLSQRSVEVKPGQTSWIAQQINASKPRSIKPNGICYS